MFEVGSTYLKGDMPMYGIGKRKINIVRKCVWVLLLFSFWFKSWTFNTHMRIYLILDIQPVFSEEEISRRMRSDRESECSVI